MRIGIDAVGRLVVPWALRREPGIDGPTELEIDALIAATAAHHGHTLRSADRRATAVYAALGVEVVYVAS